MDALNLNNISEALLKVGESLIALSAAISPNGTDVNLASSSHAVKQAPAAKKRAPRVHKPMNISEDLAAFIVREGVELEPSGKVTRPVAEAAVMKYIHDKTLQSDPKDKRKIYPDEDLANLFINGSEAITVLTLKGAIKHHFLPEDEEDKP